MRSENMAKTPVMPIAKTSVPERKSESLNPKEFAAVCMLVYYRRPNYSRERDWHDVSSLLVAMHRIETFQCYFKMANMQFRSSNSQRYLLIVVGLVG